MFNRILLTFSLILITSGLLLITFRIFPKAKRLISPISTEIENKILPLTKYEIDNLKKTSISPEQLILANKLETNQNFTSYIFYLANNQSSVSGLLNLPNNLNPKGLIFLIRGYVDREIFTSGTGTKRIGELLAENGYVTLAPDFLGYGNSSMPSNLSLEERFQTYTTMLAFLRSNSQIKDSIQISFPEIKTDLLSKNIGLFGHSNGGHIALATLEITGKPYPTVLWAPVSKPFPFSILAYTDEYDDKGKALRKIISDFEVDYDAQKYSIDNYFELINAPLSIHQGLNDIEVPYWWSDEFVEILKKKNKDVEYFTYPGENHNFNQDSWDILANRTVKFYLKQFATKH